MEKYINFLKSNARGKGILFLFILTSIIYLIMLLVTIPMTMEFSGGMKLPDMMPMGYEASYIRELFRTLGAEGREIYLKRQLPLDMVYPFLFAITYSLVIVFFLKKLNKLRPPLIYICLLPVIAGAADYLENFGIITMLTSYPDLSDVIVIVINVFSIIKSISTTILFVALMGITFTVALKTIRNRRTGSKKGADLSSAKI